MSTNSSVHPGTLCRNIPKPTQQHGGYTAIITGANGISGFHTLRALLRSPERWTRVYALSRRPPPSSMMGLLSKDEQARVTHVACDFMSSGDQLAKSLQEAGVKADYVFFYSYFQPAPKEGASIWSNAQELLEVNSTLLRNFLEALPIADIHPRRILLQTGAKYYSAHLGTIAMPAIESDPRTELEPNFYYPQEDMLAKYCQDHQTAWNVVRPAWIIGATTNAQMNALYPFAVYAAVQQHLGKTLAFPGGFGIWNGLQYHSSAMLTGHLSEWAVLEDQCKNQALNSMDIHTLPWIRFWPELARWYGVEQAPPPGEDHDGMIEIMLPHGKNSPIGYGPANVYKLSFTMEGWAKEDQNAKAWKEIMKIHGLTHNPFDDVDSMFPFADRGLFPVPPLSMGKACRLGWTGYVDTIESIWLMYDEMHKLGMLPPMKVNDPRPLV